MFYKFLKFFIPVSIGLFFSQIVFSQSFIISGKVLDGNSDEPIKNVSIQLKGFPDNGTISKKDGSFRLTTSEWSDSLQLTCVGFQTQYYHLDKHNLTSLEIQMQPTAQALEAVVIFGNKGDKEPGKRYMEKVIAHKKFNDPDRFKSYSSREYLRHEIDISNLDEAAVYGKGLKALTINIYRNSGPGDASLLPLYFSENVYDIYHSNSSSVDRKNLIAKKTLGLETDKFLWQLDKFSFSFNIYRNWLPIFNQTFASPLNDNAFNYYNYFFQDSDIVNNHKIYTIRFIPKEKYETAFSGTLVINDSTFSIKKVQMHLSPTANLDFIKDVRYSEEYALFVDSATKKPEYMPSKYSSIVQFETGLELLGIPVPPGKKKVRLTSVNTTVVGNININSPMAAEFAQKIKKEPTSDLEKPEAYWQQNRFGDSLTQHEKNIYVMADSLKKNRRYSFDAKVINMGATGFWDFSDRIRLGPYFDLLSTNNIEGLRFRTGFWTLEKFNKKLNLNGYLAYGTKDEKFKGGGGIKYIWNRAKWTKTSVFASSDYDYMTEEDDDLDQDNLINSYFRKNIPTTRIYLKQILLEHEQYISKDFSINGGFTYKEMTPVFDFSYHPISKETQMPIDSVFLHTLTQSEANLGFRFTKNERNFTFNYDLYHYNTYHPIYTIDLSTGLKVGNAQFNYQKVRIGVEQQLRLPPKSLFYYNIRVGKTFGTAPYLLLDVPPGNEYYVADRTLFNTMIPYEFATDEFASLNSRLYLGGIFFNKIPFIKKLGWRERFSFNAFTGSMSAANRNYNKGQLFTVPDKQPFMEAGVGIENIFHVFSIDYYYRLSNVTVPGMHKGAFFPGVNITF